MDILTRNSVKLGAKAVDKVDAIRQSGDLLAMGGYVSQAYVIGMLAREKVLSTYLGNGIAIPHGRAEDFAAVIHAGVSVLQLPEGVEWEPGMKAYLVIALAATPDQPISILSNLTEVVQDPLTSQTLALTSDPMAIINCLTQGKKVLPLSLSA